MNSHGVEYVLAGGHAVAWHGYPPFTGDIDIFVRASGANCERIVAVLKSFGLTDVDDLRSLLVKERKVIQLGRPPNRIDLLTGVSGGFVRRDHNETIGSCRA